MVEVRVRIFFFSVIFYAGVSKRATRALKNDVSTQRVESFRRRRPRKTSGLLSITQRLTNRRGYRSKTNGTRYTTYGGEVVRV